MDGTGIRSAGRADAADTRAIPGTERLCTGSRAAPDLNLIADELMERVQQLGS